MNIKISSILLVFALIFIVNVSARPKKKCYFLDELPERHQKPTPVPKPVCVQNVLCIKGDHWDTKLCRCVPNESPAPAPAPQTCDAAMRAKAAENCATKRGTFNADTCECTPPSPAPAPAPKPSKGSKPKPGKPSKGSGPKPGKPSKGSKPKPGKPSKGSGPKPGKPSKGSGPKPGKPSKESSPKTPKCNAPYVLNTKSNKCECPPAPMGGCKNGGTYCTVQCKCINEQTTRKVTEAPTTKKVTEAPTTHKVTEAPTTKKPPTTTQSITKATTTKAATKKTSGGSCRFSSAPVNGCQFSGQIWNQTACACTCPKETSCPPGQFFSPKRGCKCVYECTGKPPAAGCPHRQKWCIETCTCECEDAYEMPHDGCPSGTKYSKDTCNCDCANKVACDDIHYWDDSTCSCVCNEPPPAVLPSNKRWSTTYCEEVCITKQTCVAPKSRWDGNNCVCTCPTPKPTCATGSTYSSDTCACECNGGPKPCSDGFSWSKDKCDCVKCDTCKTVKKP